jgi:BASS family bile acid:Na+ symporter
MMLLLFLSFLRIDFTALVDTSRSGLIRLSALASMKLLIIPIILYYAFDLVLPEYALPALLLAGISTGVVAPFIAGLVRADMEKVLRMVILTSVLAPFTLPVLVKLLAGRELEIPLILMIRLLALVIFIPLFSVVILRRLFPGLPQRISSIQYPVSLCVFGVINLGVFSKYSSFFFERPTEILVSLLVAFVLCAIFFVSGFLAAPAKDLSERLAWGVSLAIMNNVLVIVFSSQFFGPLCPTLAAMYMFPFFTMIVPVKALARYMEVSAPGRRP